VRVLAYLDPLTYGVDGLRSVLIGVSVFPPLVDFGALCVFAAVFVMLGAYFFEKSDAV
jgi:ABC-2 type transport system permease protein